MDGLPKRNNTMIQISKPNITEQEILAVTETLRSGQLAQGPKVAEFEQQFAEYCGSKYAVAVNNGTSALHCALYSLNIGPGDEVITTPFTFGATANSILMQNAKVIFADISEIDFNIDPASIETHITGKTKAVIPVDLYGQIYNVDEVDRLAKKYSLEIIEDAAQSIGAEFQGIKSGNFGSVSTFSFYVTKNITAGVGGMITTNDENIVHKCKLFRHHGQDEQNIYEYLTFGYNYRMMDMIAAMGSVQLSRISELNGARRKNAEIFLQELKLIPGIILPTVKQGFKHAWHQFTLRITPEFKLSRDDFVSAMYKKGIQCKIYYPKPLHLFDQFKASGFREGDFPVCEKLAKEVVSIPIHPLVSQNEIAYIIESIKEM